MSENPIFDSVQADQGVAVPLPPAPTHDDFLVRSEYPEFLMHAEAILRGDVAPKASAKKRQSRPRKPAGAPA